MRNQRQNDNPKLRYHVLMMHILITGATGMVGSRLSAALSVRGHKLTIVSRDPERARLKLGLPATCSRWNPGRLEMPLAADSPFDAVVNLAGESIGEGRWNKTRKRELLASRTNTCKTLAAFFDKNNSTPATWIQASAVGYYGTGESLCDESAPAGNDFLARLCVDWEAEATRSCPPDTELRTLRLGVVLAARTGMLARLYPLFARGLGGRVGSGRQWFSWIHIDDLVALFVRAIEEKSFPALCNAVSPHPVRQKDFARAFASALHKRTGPPAPGIILRAAMGEQSVLALQGQQVVSQRSEVNGLLAHPEITEALQSLFGKN